MTRQRILRAFALAGFAVPFAPIASSVSAQEVVAPATPNADRLAAQMRILATDPRNVEALLIAGEMSARLNDPSAAAGFFARAQALAPGNPRVQAGQAMVMVRMEKPGEALRLFAAAERAGVAMRPYASDRGMAYDLIGAQGHAQREHRLAMQDDPDDDTVRRYALSLGISGRTDEAMAVLDPLLRRSDRGAWRARAFIQAMNGDAAGADKIAASMMGGFGSALSPFFRRLPTLSPADKAFAVHFGELRRTPARIADAQAAPPLPTLAPEPPVRTASVEQPRSAEPVRPRRRSETRSAREASQRARERQEAEQLAARRAVDEAEARRIAEARAAQEREAQRQAEIQRQAEAQRVTDARAAQERAALEARQREADRVAAAERTAREAEQRRLAEASAAQPTAPPPATPPASAPVSVARAPDPAPRPGFAADGAMVLPAEGTAGAPPRIGAEDNVIARIVSGITIPASELGVEPMPGREEPQVAEATLPPVPAPEPVAAPKPEPEPVKPEPAAKKAEPKPQPKAPAKAKPKPDPAKTDPARHWVQVAGGANVDALPREWKKLSAEAPAEFRGKQAWTTPLRFTNRLLTGPFKSEGAAQDFVNAIAKKGLSAFAWTSEAGQKIEKLDVK